MRPPKPGSLALRLGSGRRECSRHNVRRNLALIYLRGSKWLRSTGMKLNRHGPSFASSVNACIKPVKPSSTWERIRRMPIRFATRPRGHPAGVWERSVPSLSGWHCWGPPCVATTMIFSECRRSHRTGYCIIHPLYRRRGYAWRSSFCEAIASQPRSVRVRRGGVKTPPASSSLRRTARSLRAFS